MSVLSEKLPPKTINQKVFKMIQLTSRENMLLQSLIDFYNNEDHEKKLLNILNGEISFRLIDYFLTNYSKKNKVQINKLNKHGEKSLFNVHSEYKNKLKTWNKPKFDPFSRGDRIPFFLKSTAIITTFGQLNCCQWLIKENIYDYIIKNHNKIKEKMEVNGFDTKKNTKNKNRIKKPKINKFIKKPIIMNTQKKVGKIEVCFD